MDISVLMSVYNGERHLREAIDSILNQTFKDFEFIIVNDGSTDSSEKIIQEYQDDRIRYIKRENGGLSAALNTGLFVAKGKYIARMDADDFSVPDRLEKQFDYMEKNPNLVALGGGITYMEEEGDLIFSYVNTMSPDQIRENILQMCPIAHPTVFYRTDVAQKCGGYYEKIKQYFEDHLLFKKMLKYGDLYSLQEPLLHYRLVSTSITSNKEFMSEYLAIRQRTLVNESISDEDRDRLFEIKKHGNTNLNFKKSKYHLYLGKLYLWKNVNKKKSRKNLRISLKNHFKLATLALYMVTFLPSFIVVNLYNYVDKRRTK
ncbi:glycosyltransferase [Aquimarina spongiae]|uniref:Glycosyltransferase involved in cell wall bisynthesis n=1 Tax=Aquimarina spongiae TaxID=570521 RepID=A0A1M6FAC3_9FLAO|nr:glycosyltransferase [Aquimarina spongiae]SHI94601.1 Glycosyltransferase involved in cell wall bisynthesis [Aquimarina spongiae]